MPVVPTVFPFKCVRKMALIGSQKSGFTDLTPLQFETRIPHVEKRWSAATKRLRFLRLASMRNPIRMIVVTPVCPLKLGVMLHHDQ